MCQQGMKIEFLGAQRVHVIDPLEEILDSCSTVTLSKRKDEMKDLRYVEGNVIMLTNNGKKGLEQEGNWKEWAQTYLDEMALTNIVLVLDTV